MRQKGEVSIALSARGTAFLFASPAIRKEERRLKADARRNSGCLSNRRWLERRTCNEGIWQGFLSATAVLLFR
jgi:hypothetical protein